MRKLITLFIFVFISSTLLASGTVVKGNAKQFKGKELELFTTTDYITLKKEALGFTTIEDNGAYNFNFNANEIKKVYLKIEDKMTSFFIEPGKVYNLNLSFSEALNQGRIYDKQLSLNFIFPVPSELNQQIGKFNTKFDDFIAENRAIFEKRDHSIEVKLKAFHVKMLKEFEATNNKFIIDYINYSIASTQSALDVSYKKSDAKKGNNVKANLYLEYLDKKTILYSNPEYMSFFKNFFKGEFKTLSLKVAGFDISKAINDKARYSALDKALSKYPFLEDEEFRSLFMLNGLREVSKDKYFKKENIIKILNEIKSTSKYPKHEIIAKNIIERITKKKFGIGSNAPLFSLKNKDGNEVSLSKFKGKPLYINFWTNWSIPSQKEMKIMQILYKKYKGKIEFISICADNDFSKMTKFLTKNEDYSWPFLHIGESKKTLSDYGVATFPTYVLIDKNLKVVRYPAGRPGGTAERATEDNIDQHIFELINK